MSISVTIDGKTYQAEQGDMIIEVADKHGIAIPRFCYHEKLSIAANCRMCLVYTERSPKPVPACATPVSEGMVIDTKSEKTQESQKSVMEFLLINHPLDCPVCDQGGECELQDLAMKYGYKNSRYQEEKRSVKDVDLGPLVSTDMTRCIHCTRCIRFGTEIAGSYQMGVAGRGEAMQVGLYLQTHLSGELSANVIDLCPVGALTSKPHRHQGRTWEYQGGYGISLFDSFGSNVSWHYQDHRLKRILAKEHSGLNENWISDRDRYSGQGLYHDERMKSPFLKKKTQRHEVDLQTALDFVAHHLTDEKVGSDSLFGLIHPNSTYQEHLLFQKLLRTLGSSFVDYRIQHYPLSAVPNAHGSQCCSGQQPLETFLQEPLLIVGNYLEKDYPLFVHRLRQSARLGQRIYQIGWSLDSLSIESLEAFSCRPDQIASVLQALREKQNDHLTPLDSALLEKISQESSLNILTAPSLTALPAYHSLLLSAQQLSHQKNGHCLSLDYGHASGAKLAEQREGGPTQGFLYHKMLQSASPKTLVLFNVYPKDTLVPEQFLQMVKGASCVIGFYPFADEFVKDFVDVALPIALLSENEGSHRNIFGQTQHYQAAHKPLGLSQMGWKLLTVLGRKMQLSGFEAERAQDLCAHQEGSGQSIAAVDSFDEQSQALESVENSEVLTCEQIYHVRLIHSYRQEELLRRSQPLQKTLYGQAVNKIFLSPALAQRYQIDEGSLVEVFKNEEKFSRQVSFDPFLEEGTIISYNLGSEESSPIGPVRLRKVD